MQVNYQKWFSQSLGRDMEYKVYGDGKRSMLVFPSQDGRFFDFENFDMINVLAPHIDNGELRVICCDSIDWETWSNANADANWRIEQHERWYNYIIDELIPSVRRGTETFIASGCSMGGFHSGNFFFRRPDLFDSLLAFSGIYHASYFFGSFSNTLVYLNSPIDYLQWMPDDHFYWNIYRQRKIVCCVGQGKWEDDLLESTRRLDTILAQKGVPHQFDYWGFDSDHDWPWWRKQLAYLIGRVL